MTLLVRRLGHSYVKVWGHVRPAAAVATVSVFTRTTRRGPHLLRRIRTDSYGYFSFGSAFHPGLRWRAVARLAGGRRLQGPYIPAVRFRAPPLR